MSGQSFKVVWTNAARRSLEAIEQYITRNNPAAAERFGRKIRERTSQLAFTPQMGFRSKVRASYGEVREIIVQPYRILYRLEDETVIVFLVWHGARRNPSLKDFIE